MMKIIYQNYNIIREGFFEDRRIVVKKFKERFCWENETKVIGILRGYGFPVPEIIKSSPLENIYSFFDMPIFADVLKEKFNYINILLDLLSELQKVRDPFLHKFNGREKKLLQVSESLYNHNKIGKSVLENIERICGLYKPQSQMFCHGDYRPENLFYLDGIGGIIDFEFSGIDDPNKDLAYLWVGTVRLNKSFNHYLKNMYVRFTYYDTFAFVFWLTYIHAMILSNPRIKDQPGWALNLKNIVEKI